MKPSKRQNNSDKTTKTINEASTSKIKDYFKTTTKSFALQDVQKKDRSDGPKDFYVALLKERLQKLNNVNGDGGDSVKGACGVSGSGGNENGNSVQCAGAFKLVNGQINDIDNNSIQDFDKPDGDEGTKTECTGCVQKSAEFKELKEKYHALKSRYLKLTTHHSETDLKYHDLLKASTGRVKPVNDCAASNGDVFTKNELKFLDSMQLDKKKDSTFVHQCLQFAYKDKLGVLVNKTLKGTKEWIEITKANEQIHHFAKDPLSPAKVDRIRELYIARIAKCNIDAVTYGERIGNINKHFASGIKNISKTQH